MFDGGEQHYKFAKLFKWKTLNLNALEQTICIRRNRNPQNIAYLSLEITLTERLPDREIWGKALDVFKKEKYPFTEDAYRPQTYTVRLESGRFALPFMVEHYHQTRFPDSPEYALRLVFDKSPYHQKIQVNCPWNWSNSIEEVAYYYAEYKEFVSYEIGGSDGGNWGISRCVVN